ncbi:MAG TPA: hypothetical protein VNJ31_04600, partial [Methyloceanibacter sp.]|nr:hypothetical protein [Methyloceanibacter sp.]
MLLSLVLYARAGLVTPRRPIADFYAAGRLVPPPLAGASIAAGFVSLIALTGFAGALGDRWGALLLLLGSGGGLLFIAFLVAAQLRKFGGYSIADFLGERFEGKGVRQLAVLAVILCSFPALAVALIALGDLAERVFAVDSSTGAGLGMAMLLLCCLVGGMRSASITQVLQYALLLGMSALALVLLLGGQRTGTSLNVAAFSEAFTAERFASFAARDWINRVGLLFCVAAGTAALPSLIQSSAVTTAPEKARAAFLWSLPLAATLALPVLPQASLLSGEGGGLGPLATGLIMAGAMAGCL